MIVFKAKAFYKMKKKHRELMKLFKPEHVPLKVKHGLRKALKKGDITPTKSSLQAMGLGRRFPVISQVKKASRILPISYALLPICMMFDWMLLVIPVFIGAVMMFDWANNIKPLSGGHRCLSRDSSGYWYSIAINEGDNKGYIIKSVDNGVSWGTNHPAYDDNTPFNIWNTVIEYMSMAIAINGNDYTYVTMSNATANSLHTYRHIPGDITAWGDLGNINTGAADPFENTTVCLGDDCYVGWRYLGEIEKRYYDFSVVGWVAVDHVTAGSAETCKEPAFAFDSNNHLHCSYTFMEANQSIRYAHQHDSTGIVWKQSDDVSVVTTGESGEIVMQTAAKIFESSSIVCNPVLSRFNDVWIGGENETDEEVYANQFDVSGAAWIGKAKVSDTDVAEAPQVGISNDGIVHMMWSIETTGSIRHSEFDTSWSTPDTLQS